MALGASRSKVVQLILQGAFLRVSFGLVLGLPLAVGAGRLIASELYGISSWDPVALIVAASALAMSAFLAAIIPAMRAASISPVIALKSE
jgi:ABC-type antimicrobial peptide transport system permease subunit